MKQLIIRYQKLITATLFTALAIGSFFYGLHLRSYLQNSYNQSAADGSQLPLELVTAYQPTPGISDVGEQRGDVDLQPMETFYRVLRALRENYVERIEPTQEKEMAYGALRSMLGALNDPYSRFLEPEKYDTIKDQFNGKFHGIGAILTIRKSMENGREITRLVVVSTMPGTPSEKAGLKPGDIISHLDSQWVVSYDPYIEVNKLAKLVQARRAEKSALTRAFEAAEAKLRKATTAQKALDSLTASVKKEYNLTVVRDQEKLPLQIKIESSDVLIEPVAFRIIGDDTGYIAIRFLTSKTPDAVSQAIAVMKKEGVKKLVVDLRGCSGGLDTSLASAMSEICPGKALSVIRKAKNKEQVLKAGQSENAVDWQKIAVLVDRSTANLGEVAAAGLRDSAGAIIVGERTCGAAKQQTIVPHRDGSAIIFTSGEYLTPKRQAFDNKGVTPAVNVGTSGAGDQALEKALEIIGSTKTVKEAAGA